jgi:uncharacterized Zn finger protein
LLVVLSRRVTQLRFKLFSRTPVARSPSGIVIAARAAQRWQAITTTWPWTMVPNARSSCPSIGDDASMRDPRESRLRRFSASPTRRLSGSMGTD